LHDTLNSQTTTPLYSLYQIQLPPLLLQQPLLLLSPLKLMKPPMKPPWLL
jgi:hypothetical protein